MNEPETLLKGFFGIILFSHYKRETSTIIHKALFSLPPEYDLGSQRSGFRLLSSRTLPCGDTKPKPISQA